MSWVEVHGKPWRKDGFLAAREEYERLTIPGT